MKKAILTVLAMLMLIIPAYATDGDSAIVQQEQGKKSVEVGSFEELQTAIDDAKEGDVIILTQGNIHIPNGATLGSTDKQICIQLVSDYLDAYCSDGIFILDSGDMTTFIKNIRVDGGNIPTTILINTYCNTEIENSTFCNLDTDLSNSLIRGNSIKTANIIIKGCKFYNIRADYAGIYSAYRSNTGAIENCEFENITGNSYALISNDGEMFIGANHYKGGLNGSKNRLIGNSGTLIIDNDLSHYIDYYGYAPKGWYKITDETGTILYNPQRIETEINGTCGLTFFTEQATDYIAPEQSQDDDNPDNPDEEDSENTQSSQEPGDQTGNDGTKGEDQSPQEPAQPSEGTDNPTENPDNMDGDDNAPQKPAQPPKDGGEDDTDTPSNAPEQPTEPPQDDNTDDTLEEGQDTPQSPQFDSKNESDENPEQSINPPQEQQPEDGKNEDDPADDPLDSTKTPVEPPQDTSDQDKDNPSDNPNSTPDTPQKPSDSDNGEDDSSTPSTDYRPSHRPTRPSTSSTTPAETDQTQEKTDNDIPAPAKPQLTCNGAVIDTSRTVVLLGYGDGLLHENDPLTRAQLATIVYRLLDDDSIASYSNAQLAFVDVAANAWYAPYVRVIQAAGIVNGIGDGKYDPNGLVCWNQILTILTRFVEPQEYKLQHIQYDGWATQSIQTAVALDWIEDRADFDPDAVIGRGELAQLINSVLALYRI